MRQIRLEGLETSPYCSIMQMTHEHLDRLSAAAFRRSRRWMVLLATLTGLCGFIAGAALLIQTAPPVVGVKSTHPDAWLGIGVWVLAALLAVAFGAQASTLSKLAELAATRQSGARR